MSSPCPRVRCLPLRGLLALCLLAAFLAIAPRAGASANAADVSFPTVKAVLWLGHTQIIPLHLKAPADADTPLSTSVLDSRLAAIVRPAVFLAGEQTAYLRVRALQAGQTRLEVFGGPALELEIKPDPAEAANASIDQESRRPEIISPDPGAVVWGEFAVGVTMFDDAPVAPAGNVPPADGSGAPAAGAMKVQLRLPDGRLLDPINATAAAYGPERQYQFSVPADLPVGALRLVAVATREATGLFDKGGGGKPSESLPLTLQLETPAPESIWKGECESPEVMGMTKNLYAPARPTRMGTEQPNLGKDANASGAQFVQSVNRGWCLPFVAKAAGNYQLILRARGEFGGGAYPSVAIYIDNTEAPVTEARLVGSKYDRMPIGTPVHLEAGPQLLTVQFKNGFGGGHENRNLFLDSYELALVGEEPGGVKGAAPAASAPVSAAAAPALHSALAPVPEPTLTAVTMPRISILYPANGAAVFGADAVVAQASGGTARVQTVDLLVDGALQHVPLPNSAGNDPLILPLVARGLAPGEHRIAVRATVASGQTVDSPARLLVVLPQAPEVRGPYDRAVYLLDRLAFGPEPREIAAVLTQGESKWLATRLIATFNNPGEEKVLLNACKSYPHIDSDAQTPARALNQWMDSGNPVRSRFTAWAENHFSTWITKTKAAPKWDEHLTFCRLGIAPFGDLLEASAHSAAMLEYLDQEKSYAGKINENYAREIMELHTLGVHGGYKQADVTELAEVLNGWTTAREAELPDADSALHLVSDERGGDAGLASFFHFVPALNDGKPRRVFGLDFAAAADPTTRYDRVQLALEMLAAHPSTAEHVCRKLAEHYVGVPAPDALVNHLATVFLESGGDMRVVLFSMVGDRAFWQAAPKVATPFDYALRAARLCHAAAVQAEQPHEQVIKAEVLESFLKHSGMGLFDRVTPDGYPEDSDAYADSNALLQRWRFMQTQSAALSGLVPAAWRSLPPAPQAGPSGDDDLSHPDSPGIDPVQRFVDLAAVRLTGHLLSPSSNKAALEVAGQGSPDELEQTLIFVSLLPETSLR